MGNLQKVIIIASLLMIPYNFIKDLSKFINLFEEGKDILTAILAAFFDNVFFQGPVMHTILVIVFV